MTAWLRARSARQILIVGLAIFLIYSWPGFVGWDTREHMLQARSGIYTDGHPPAVAHLVRLVEVFVTGPAGMLLIQAVTLLVGLYMLLKTRLSSSPVGQSPPGSISGRAAALAACGIFLFPVVSGVTALITKDALMAGSLMIAIALMLDERTSRHRLALGFLIFASLMRWNALAATFVPMILLFRWRPHLAGFRRYAIAFAMWFGVTAVAYEGNELLTTEREHLWYWSFAYEDIGGTLEYMPDLDDAAMAKLFDGVPLIYHDNLHARFRAIYNPASHYHLMRDEGRLLIPPQNEAQRDAVAATWRKVVLGHPDAYLKYRWDNYLQVLSIDRPPSFSNVYVWFNVIAYPQAIDELHHDAAPSRIQAKLIEGSIAVSLSPVYYIFIYGALCLVLLPLCARNRLEMAVLLSAVGYQLQWFFLAATSDLRYSQWMVLCSLVALVLRVARYAMRGTHGRADPVDRRPRL